MVMGVPNFIQFVIFGRDVTVMDVTVLERKSEEYNYNTHFRSSQWSKIRGQHFSIMLHADMAIYKSFNVSGQFDEPDCEFDDCPFASTAVYVNKTQQQ